MVSEINSTESEQQKPNSKIFNFSYITSNFNAIFFIIIIFMEYWSTIKYFAILFCKGVLKTPLWHFTYLEGIFTLEIVKKTNVQNTMGPAYYCVHTCYQYTLVQLSSFGGNSSVKLRRLSLQNGFNLAEILSIHVCCF